MLGAIAGDIIGSVHESRYGRIKTTDFTLFEDRSTFTDDTVLTVATAWAILKGEEYGSAYKRFGRRYPNAGYGMAFRQWLLSDDTGPYNSWGNGSAMRVSPVAWACGDERAVLEQAAASAAVTHNHPEGVKGAQATALAVWLARMGADKREIRRRIQGDFGYNLHRTADEIRPGYRFDSSCAGSVPEAIVCFLDSNDYESAVRLAVSLGGDGDTQACIAGAIAEAFYGPVPPEIAKPTRERLPEDLLAVVDEFAEKFPMEDRA